MNHRGLEDIKEKQILLDTSVIFSLLDKSYRYQITDWLKKLVENKNSLFVSDITRFELLRREDFDETKKRVVLNVFNKTGVPHLLITQDRITNAAILCKNMYPHAVKNEHKKI